MPWNTLVDVTAAGGETCLVDARSPERFAGEHEPIDPIAGHIPGARNRPFQANLDEGGRFKSATTLQAEWQPLIDAADSRPLVAMCGSGVTACHHVLALTHAGVTDVGLYPGSWSEWICEPRRGVVGAGAAS